MYVISNIESQSTFTLITLEGVKKDVGHIAAVKTANGLILNISAFCLPNGKGVEVIVFQEGDAVVASNVYKDVPDSLQIHISDVRISKEYVVTYINGLDTEIVWMNVKTAKQQMLERKAIARVKEGDLTKPIGVFIDGVPHIRHTEHGVAKYLLVKGV